MLVNTLTRYLVIFLLVVGLAACGGGSGSSSNDRDYELYVPASYDGLTATPLIVVLHGFGGSGSQILGYFRLADAAERHGFLVAYPTGISDAFGRNHWNGTDACCAFTGIKTDDVGFLSTMLDDIEANFNVDAKQIFLTGYSNGGFMSHRMACDRSGRIAAIAALAGVSWDDPNECQTQEPVSILQVHGDLDGAILYAGGFSNGVPYPSANDTVSDWANLNGCTGSLVNSGLNIDIDQSLGGDETVVERFTGCPSNGEVELWTIVGGGHGPSFDDSWPDALWGFFSTHPKP